MDRKLDAALAQIKFDSTGLVPVIAQDHASGQVLMMAWMNRDSLIETLNSKRVAYWSRTRGEIWRKGETSGQVQDLVEMRLDCDGDTVLLLVRQTGVACHTGRQSCFYRVFGDDGLVELAMPRVDPKILYPSPKRSDK